MNMVITDKKFDKGQWFSLLFLLAGLLATGVAWWEGERLVKHELSTQLDARAKDAKKQP